MHSSIKPLSRCGRLITCCVFLFVGTGKGQKRSISIKETLNLIPAGQPRLQALKEQSSAAGYGIQLAKSTLIPNLTGAYQAGYATDNNITGMSFPGLLLPLSGPVAMKSSSLMVPGSALTALLLWNPLTFGQRNAAVDEAWARYRLATSNYNETLFRQEYAAIVVYLDIIYLQRLFAAQKANVERTRIGLEQSLALAMQGIRPGLDTVQFQSLLAQAQMESLATQKQVQDQLVELCRLTGIANRPDELELVDSDLCKRLPLAPDTSGTVLLNPIYEVSLAQVDLETANLKAVERSWRPKLDLWGNAYSRGSGIDPNGTINKSDGWQLSRSNLGIGFQLSFPILQFAAFNLQKKQQKSLLSSDRATLSQTQFDLEQQARAAQYNYQSSIVIAQQAPVQTNAARLSFQGLELSYQSGLIDYTRLTQGQYQLLNAEMMEAAANIEVWKSLLDIGVSKGKLNVFTDQLK